MKPLQDKILEGFKEKLVDVWEMNSSVMPHQTNFLR
jgi:hypothetical protein